MTNASKDTRTLTLTDFLLARIAEDEEAARAATPGPWQPVTYPSGNRGLDAGTYDEVIVPGDVICGSYCYGGTSTLSGDRLEEGPSPHRSS